MKIPLWKRAIIEYKTKKLIKNIQLNNQEEIREIIGKICDLIEKQEQDKQFYTVSVICANIIGGFETPEERDMALNVLKLIINAYNNEDK